MLNMQKGAFGDVLVILVILVTLAIALIGGYIVVDNFATGIERANVTVANEAMSEGKGMLIFFDGLFVMLYVGLNLGAVILAYNIKTHPIMLGFFFLLAPVFVIVPEIIANMYYNVASGSDILTTTANLFPMTATIMNNLVVLTIVMLFIVGIVSYTRLESHE